jgi:hypothetical protein
MTNPAAHPRPVYSGQDQIQRTSGPTRTAGPSQPIPSTAGHGRIGARSPAQRSPSPDSDKDFRPVPIETVTTTLAGPIQVSLDASLICGDSHSHELPSSRRHR